MARRVLLLLLAIALVGCAPGASAMPSSGPSSSAGAGALPPEVSVSEADRMRQAGALVLDVREPSEWATGTIPGATLISLGELAARATELPKERSIVVVCRSGNRSAQGRDILFARGFGSVTSMAGGMTDWARAGLPVTAPG